MTEIKISSFQFYTLLFLTNLLTTVTYIPSYAKGNSATDTILLSLISPIIILIFALPLLKILKKNPQMNILEIAEKKSIKFRKVLTIIYSIVIFYFTLTNTLRLDLFTGTVVFPKTNVNFFLVFVIVICCYGAYFGLEAIGRSGVLSLFSVFVALIFIFATLIKRVDFLYFPPLFYNGAKPFLMSTVVYFGRISELILVGLLWDKVGGKKQKGFMFWAIIQGVVAVAFQFLTTGVMGNFADSQLFPIHTLSALAEYAMFKRLDALITGIWLLCAFLKLSLYIYLQVELLHREFSKISKTTYLILIGTLLCVLGVFGGNSVNRFLIIDRGILKAILLIVLVFFVPFYLLICERKRKNA